MEDASFQSLLETLDARYPVPGRAVIGKEMDKLLLDMKLKVEASLAEARKISFCADVWSKKGISSSYLGVTAHFFSQRDHQRHQVTLAVRRLPHPHTGENIRDAVESILEEWSIPLSKVRVVITDNGSNMVKAFRQHFEEDDKDDDGEEDDGSVKEVEPEASVQDEENFEDREMDHDITFKFYCKRLSCFAHTLQLVVNKFSEERSFQKIMKRASALVRKVNKSSKATEKLLSLCCKKLVGKCPTRWSSTFLMIERLLEVKIPLTQVLEELEWESTTHLQKLHSTDLALHSPSSIAKDQSQTSS